MTTLTELTKTKTRTVSKWRRFSEYLVVPAGALKDVRFNLSTAKGAAKYVEENGIDVAVVKNEKGYYYLVSPKDVVLVSKSKRIATQRSVGLGPLYVVVQGVGYYNPFWKKIKTFAGWVRHKAGRARRWIGSEKREFSRWRRARARRAYVGRKREFYRTRATLRRERAEIRRDAELAGLRAERAEMETERSAAEAETKALEQERKALEREALRTKVAKVGAVAERVGVAAYGTAGVLPTLLGAPAPVPAQPVPTKKPKVVPVKKVTVSGQAADLLGPIIGTQQKKRKR